MKLLCCFAIWRDPVGLLLDSRLRPAPLHWPNSVLHLLYNDLLLLVRARHLHLVLSNYTGSVSCIIYCVRCSKSLIPLPPLSPSFLHHHLLAVKLLDCSNVLLIHVLILANSRHTWVHDGVCRFILRGLSSRSGCWEFQATYYIGIVIHQDVLLGAIGFGAQDWRLFVGGGWLGSSSTTLRNLRGVHSVVVVTMVSSRVRVLIKVHQDVLNLGLLRGMHDHDYRSGVGLLGN